MLCRIVLYAILATVLAGCSRTPAPIGVPQDQEKNLPPEVTGDPPAKAIKKK